MELSISPHDSFSFWVRMAERKPFFEAFREHLSLLDAASRKHQVEHSIVFGTNSMPSSVFLEHQFANTVMFTKAKLNYSAVGSGLYTHVQS